MSISTAFEPVWPSPTLERDMLADASLLEAASYGVSPGADAACHIKALLTRVRELEAVVADKDRELQARREILDALSDAAGNGNCWLNAATLDWRQRLRDFAEDREQHRLTAAAWDANRDSFPGVVLYAVGGFYVGYFDDAAELWGQSDDTRPMFHVMVKSDPPHRTVIHAMHLNAWVDHLAEIHLPVTIVKPDDGDFGEDDE